MENEFLSRKYDKHGSKIPDRISILSLHSWKISFFFIIIIIISFYYTDWKLAANSRGV